MVLGGYKFRLRYNTYGYNSISLRITGAWLTNSDVAQLRVYNGPRSSYCIGELCIDGNDAARWVKELDLNTWMKIRLSS